MAVQGGATASPLAGHSAGDAMASHWSRHDESRTAVGDVLTSVVAALVAGTGRTGLEIVDAGGGTGGFAVPLAVAGHHVTVVDPSPDSLAAAQRRAAEMSVPLRAVQGDAADLVRLVGEGSADLVLCHSVLEYVDSPAAAVAAIAAVLQPGGAVSVLAASAVAAVVHRALAGRFEEAVRLLAGIGPQGVGPATAGMRRFTLAEVTGLIEEAGLRPGATHGVRVFTDLVPGGAADTDRGAAQALAALEQAASAHPAFHDFAAQFHVLGYR
ncbi:MAG TPA: methyltransferase domain-containing protein [Streptosporangiaceae bacterium]|nr:methyltransferase domain-containing protein [Streptosporangiaceae bacterium]